MISNASSIGTTKRKKKSTTSSQKKPLKSTKLSKRATAIRNYLRSEFQLTPSESTVLAIRAEGFNNKEIVSILSMNDKCVKTHIGNANKKLNDINFFGEYQSSAVHFVYLMAVQFPIKDYK